MNSLTSTLLLDGPPVLFSIPLAQCVGLKEAIVLQKIHYWLHPNRNQNFHEGHPWVHNTYDQWQAQFPFWSLKTIFRVIRQLEKRQILLSYRREDTVIRPKYYTINYVILRELAIIPTYPSESEGISVIDQARLRPSKALAESSPNQTIPVQMVALWNERVQVYTNPGHPVSLSPKRVDALETFLTQHCEGDLSVWETYCQKISQTKFLLGNNETGFRITLDWALKPHNGRKILSNRFFDHTQEGQGERRDTQPNEPTIISWEEFDRLLDRQWVNAGATPLGGLWGKISKNLARRIGQAPYTSWFGTVSLVTLTEDVLTLQVKSRFSRDRLIEHYEAHLIAAITDVLGEKRRLHYILSPSAGDTQ